MSKSDTKAGGNRVACSKCNDLMKPKEYHAFFNKGKADNEVVCESCFKERTATEPYTLDKLRRIETVYD